MEKTDRANGAPAENVRVYVAAAFCRNGQGGNKAGVVFDRPELTRRQKMQISAHLGFSETAFVTVSARAGFRLEYFTPTEEVPLCGHATIAAFAAMRQLGRLRPGLCSIETKAGLQEMQLQEDGLILMQQNLPEYSEILQREELPASLRESADCSLPIRIVSTGLRDILVPVKSPEALQEIQPDFEAITQLSREKGAVGIHAFALTGGAAGSDAVCRNFGPLVGIPEESATGTASCALAAYLFKYRIPRENYVFEQGYALGQPSRIVVQVAGGAGIRRIAVGGLGQLLEERQLCIN